MQADQTALPPQLGGVQVIVCFSEKLLLCSGKKQGAPLNPPGVIGPGLQSLWSCVGPPQMLPGQVRPHAANGKHGFLTFYRLRHVSAITRIILEPMILHVPDMST